MGIGGSVAGRATMKNAGGFQGKPGGNFPKLCWQHKTFSADFGIIKRNKFEAERSQASDVKFAFPGKLYIDALGAIVGVIPRIVGANKNNDPGVRFSFAFSGGG